MIGSDGITESLDIILHPRQNLRGFRTIYIIANIVNEKGNLIIFNFIADGF